MPSLPPVKKFTTGDGVRIYRIACHVFDYLTARVYLLLGAGPPTLVDTGSGQGESTAQILAGLDTVRTEFDENVRPADIRRILITHGHVDHVGGLWDLLGHTNAEVLIHPLDRRAITAHKERSVVGKRRMHDFLKRAGVECDRIEQLAGTIRYERIQRPRATLCMAIKDGLQLDGLRFIHTPGHAPGHVCTIVGDVLLCGDHLLARTIPQQWPESLIPSTGLAHYLESLEKVRRIDGLVLALAAHETVIDDVYGRIDTISASQQRRTDRVLRTVRNIARPLTICEIARMLYEQVDGFHAVLAICDVGARVEYLHQRGHLIVDNLDQVASQENPVCCYCVAQRAET